MSSICNHYIKGRCKFGNNCWFRHDLPLKELGANDDFNPVQILTKHWNRLAWKGSPLWIKNSNEPLFIGLGLSMEEFRWEFYRRPIAEWESLQDTAMDYLEKTRLEFLAVKGIVIDRNSSPPVSRGSRNDQSVAITMRKGITATALPDSISEASSSVHCSIVSNMSSLQTNEKMCFHKPDTFKEFQIPVKPPPVLIKNKQTT